MKPQRIAIIGAGTAGLTTAAFLSRQGHKITLIERAQALAPVGAGILLQPSGLGVLSKLGCLDNLLQFGHRIDTLHGSTQSGRVIMRMAYADLKQGVDTFGLGVHRAALCHVLYASLSAAADQGGDHEVWFGCEVASLEQNSKQALVHFAQAGESQAAEFDAVLVANGSASQLRPSTLVNYDRQYPWGAMWLMREVPTSAPHLNHPKLQQRYGGSEFMAGILPTGSTPFESDSDRLSFFWSLPVAAMADWRSADVDLAAWKAQVTNLWPELDPLIAPISSASELTPAVYRDVIMKRWGMGRVGVIGDAAHAMSPQLGQGANMALLDAFAVAEAVKRSESWPEVWADFERQRAGSIRFYQAMSRLMTPFYQSSVSGLGLARDLMLPILYKNPWLRRHMTETISGTKTSWL